MKKHFFVPALVFIVINSGCSIAKIEPIRSVQEESKQVQEPTTQIQKPEEKIITWCDKSNMEYQKEIFHEGKLWISSEYFNGINHAPTIRHLCRENKESFSLEMAEWDGTSITHHGKLISKKSGKIFAITSINTDPEVKLIEEKNENKTNRVWFTLDDKTFVYNENTDTFVKNPKI